MIMSHVLKGAIFNSVYEQTKRRKNAKFHNILSSMADARVT